MHTTQGKLETIEAFLPSSGIKIGMRATKHVYAKSEVALYQRSDGSSERMLVHLFRCTETGVLRVWGSEAVPSGWTPDNGGN